MSEWLNEVFSGGVSLARANPVGIVLMILAVMLIAASKPISNRWSQGDKKPSEQTIKLVGLVLCALGAAVAIL